MAGRGEHHLVIGKARGFGGALVEAGGRRRQWGTLIQDGQQYLQTEPWLMILPGLAILSTVLAFTLLGDGLRDALDVKMKDA